MEESTETQSTPTQMPGPPNTAPTLPPHPSQPSDTIPPKSKKRPLDSDIQIQDTEYFKMRVIVRDLRSRFIEVLRTPDFQNCEAAREICEQMGLLMELYKQMTSDSAPIVKSKNMPESEPLSGENGTGQKPAEEAQDIKPAEQPDPEVVMAKPSENKQQPEDSEPHGSYIVGGSAFGWNFITFSSSKPVYYGITKESFRSAQANLGG